MMNRALVPGVLGTLALAACGTTRVAATPASDAPAATADAASSDPRLLGTPETEETSRPAPRQADSQGAARAELATYTPPEPPRGPRPAGFDPARPWAGAVRAARTPAEKELAIWNDPTFREWFQLSYVAETEVEPSITLLEREVMEEVLELLADDEKKKAIELLQEQRGEEGNAVFDFTLANLYFQDDKLDQAAVIYETAVQKFPRFRRAWRNLGLIHVRQGDFAKARPALTKVVELGGGDAITYGLLGYAYSNEGDHVAAESAYRMANLLDPSTPDWKMGLARSFFKQGRFADAVALCDTMIAAEPERTDLWLLQANAYLGLEKPLKAAEDLEVVDRLDGSTPESLNLLGDIYVNEELFDLAAERYVRALDAGPGQTPARALRNAKVLTSRGALAETGLLLDRVEDSFADALTQDEKKDVLRLRARLAVAAGQGDEEARVLAEIVALDPLDGEALILLGQHAARTGDRERAVFYYERAESLEAFEADAKVRHAQLLVGEGSYAAALPLLRRAQDLRPRDSVGDYLAQVEKLAQR